ncbi:hypothetical protein [Citrobacter portucalensis]|uniref:hypothetical protein n=1 Tax=Citrobacter portucalensis TaxID=1639133 RepID=UPI003CEA97BE
MGSVLNGFQYMHQNLVSAFLKGISIGLIGMPERNKGNTFIYQFFGFYLISSQSLSFYKIVVTQLKPDE